MMQSVFLRASLRTPAQRAFGTATRLAAAEANSNGKGSKEHVTNSKDELDIHSEASGKGQRARQSGDPHVSSATSERDPTGSTKKAAETTKAPGPVIGMQDERGGKGDTT